MTQLDEIVAESHRSEPEVESTSAGLRSERARSLAMWSAYLLGSWLFLRPILLTTVFADDFINPFLQFTYSGVSPLELISDGWDRARAAGHINFLGQIIGGYVLTAWMLLMSVGLRYSTIYAASKLLVLVLAAVSGASLMRRSAEAIGRPITVWRARLAISVLLFGSLQLHIPWSNDPVGSYPASGFASAAIGFLVLTTALLALQRDSVPLAALVGLLGCASVWYYEINVVAVVAIVPLLIWRWLAGAAPRRPSRRLVGFGLIMVVAPGLVVAASKVVLTPVENTYTGTDVAVGSQQARGVLTGLVSTLPASAWSLSKEWLQRPIAVWTTPVVILMTLSTVLIALARRFPLERWSTDGASRLQVVALVASPLCYLVGSTVLQASTQKVQDESPKIGYVYNYYAIGATALAVIVGLLVMAAPRRWNQPYVRLGLGAVLITFVAVQSLVNWNITVRFNEGTFANRQLLVTFSEGRPVEDRCSALTTWTAGAWPEYYEQFMIDGLQDSYRHFHGQEFCPGFVAPP